MEGLEAGPCFCLVLYIWQYVLHVWSTPEEEFVHACMSTWA